MSEAGCSFWNESYPGACPARIRFFPVEKTMNKTIVVLAFFAAALLAGYYLQSLNTPAPAKPSKDVADEDTEAKEKFSQRQVGMPLDMQNAEGVTGYAAASPILGSEPKPVSAKPYEMANDQELFQFEDNKIGPECCPSPFSTDLGCVCLTDKQIKDFNKRGGNRA
jgi:hypothetical protein